MEADIGKDGRTCVEEETYINLPSHYHHSPSTTAFSMQLAQSAAIISRSEDRVTLYPNLEV